MAYTTEIQETRQYLSQWIALVTITDDDTGDIFNRQFCFDHSPSEAEILAMADQAILLIWLQGKYDENVMNLPVDELAALQYLRNIKYEVIRQIRQNPGVTLVEAQNYVDTNYPDSIVNFARLYQFYLNLLSLSTWEQFKQWVITHKFENIDVSSSSSSSSSSA